MSSTWGGSPSSPGGGAYGKGPSGPGYAGKGPSGTPGGANNTSPWGQSFWGSYGGPWNSGAFTPSGGSSPQSFSPMPTPAQPQSPPPPPAAPAPAAPTTPANGGWTGQTVGYPGQLSSLYAGGGVDNVNGDQHYVVMPDGTTYLNPFGAQQQGAYPLDPNQFGGSGASGFSTMSSPPIAAPINPGPTIPTDFPQLPQYISQDPNSVNYRQQV